MNQPLILLVEDNKKVQALNKFEFEERGYPVRLAFTLEEARRAINNETPGLIILDINMPDGDGIYFLNDELRAPASRCLNVPVLMLTGYGEDKDVVKGFESGCNDYMGKPYTFPVLLMRVKELLRRALKMPDVIEKGTLKIKILAGQALLDEKDLVLAEKEFLLLQLFMQREDSVLSAEYIYGQVWGQQVLGDNNALKNAIYRLRKK
jgi:DNA-binding response OmpR family regulator